MSADGAHKLVQCYEVTPCSTHDSQCSELLIDTPNESPDVFGDPAYRSQNNELFCMAIGKVVKSTIKRIAASRCIPNLSAAMANPRAGRACV